MAKGKGKKKLSKKERIAAKIAKIKERAAKDLERQIARAQGIKDKHGDKAAKLRDRMKAQKVSFKAKVADLKKGFEVKLAAKVAKAVAKAEKKAKRNQAKMTRTLGKLVKRLQQAAELNAEVKAIKAKVATPRSQHPAEPAVEAKPLS